MKVGVASVIILVSMVCVLASCDRKSPPADNVSSTLIAAPQSASVGGASQSTLVSADVTFTVEPGVVYSCKGRDRTTSIVKWKVTRAGVSSIKVSVMGPDSPEKKLFAQLGPTGEATTGNWVTKGVKFQLVNANTGEELASYIISELPCKG